MRIIKPFGILIVLLAILSCSKSHEPIPNADPEDNDGKVYIRVDFNPINSVSGFRSSEEYYDDIDPAEDVYESDVNELRFIIFKHGEEESFLNLYFTPDGTEKLLDRSFVFKLNSGNKYDLYAIANESCTNETDAGGNLHFLTKPSISRTQLLNAKVKAVNTANTPKYCFSYIYGNSYSFQDNHAGINNFFMMTAVYEGITLNFSKRANANGTKEKPFKLDLTEYNIKQRRHRGNVDRSGIELMRSLSKVQVILKRLVNIDYYCGEPGKPIINTEWIFPFNMDNNRPNFGFNVMNAPDSYPLFPKSRFTNAGSFSKGEEDYIFRTFYKSNFVTPNIYNCYPKPLKHLPIGGIDRKDYVVTFYLPENIVSNSNDNKKTHILFTWKRYSEEDPIVKDVNFENNLNKIDYKTIFQQEIWNNVSGVSVFRNVNYRIIVNIKEDAIIINS